MPQPPGGEPTGLTWVRVHPVTPVVRGWKVLVVLLVIAMQQFQFDVSNAARLLDEVGIGPVALVVAGVAVVGFGYATLAWRMTRYAVDAETIYLHTGVMFRRQRAARLDRIQGIDTIQPLLARLFGLTELKIEVAGGADSAVSLAFLREEVAERLRNELLARAAGLERPVGDGAPSSRHLLRPSDPSSRCRRPDRGVDGALGGGPGAVDRCGGGSGGRRGDALGRPGLLDLPRHARLRQLPVDPLRQ